MHRARHLQKLTGRLAQCDVAERIAECVLEEGMAALGANGGCAVLVNEAGTELERLGVAGAYQPFLPFFIDRFAIDAALPLAEAVRQSKAVVVETGAEARRRYLGFFGGDAHAGGGGALLALPLIVRGRAFGGLGWSWPHDGSWPDGDLEFALVLADISAQALAGARLFHAERRERIRADQAERALAQSEERFRACFEQAPVGVTQCDMETGRFTFVNPAYSAITGFSNEELLSKTWQEITHPDDRQANVALARRVLAGELSSYRLEKRYVKKDGSCVWVDLFGTLVRDDTGRPKYGVVVVVDVGERKEAENNLRQGAEELAKLMEVMPVAVWISRDRECRNIIGNRAGAALLRMAPGDNLSKTPLGTKGPSHFRVVRGGRELRPEELPLQYSAAHGVDLIGVEEDIVFDDGTVCQLYGSVSPLFDDRGQVRGAVSVFLDVSELRKAEKEWRINRDRLELVVNSIDVGLWYCDLPFDKLVWNAKVKQHFGLPADYEVTIDTFYERLNPADRERTRQAIERAIRDRTAYDIEYRTVGLDGQERWVRAIGRAFYDSAGAPVSFDGLTVDVTERIRQQEALLRQQEALQEADRRKDEFLALLAHELRNPLAPIRNALQMMQVAGSHPEALEQTRAIMDRQLRQMVRLVDDLLDVSRITRGNIELRKERVDLASVVQDAIESCRPLMESLNHDLSISLPSRPIYVDADVTRLSQIFSNLLNNGAKYTPAGGRLGIVVERKASSAVIRVHDNGIGIPSDMLTKIFDIFTQLDRTLERSRGGLGVGLTLVRRLVELHGGSVEARSEGLGRGSEFVVTVPASDAASIDGSRRSSGDDVDPSRAAGVRRRILVADDNEDSAESLGMMLEFMGHVVQTVHDGAAAVKAAETFRPDVAILDIGMPNLNGYDVAIRIRRLGIGEAVQLIAVTGWGQPEDRRRSSEAGFDHHLVKPVDFAALVKLLAATGGERESRPGIG